MHIVPHLHGRGPPAAFYLKNEAALKLRVVTPVYRHNLMTKGQIEPQTVKPAVLSKLVSVLSIVEAHYAPRRWYQKPSSYSLAIAENWRHDTLAMDSSFGERSTRQIGCRSTSWSLEMTSWTVLRQSYLLASNSLFMKITVTSTVRWSVEFFASSLVCRSFPKKLFLSRFKFSY